MTVLLLSCSLLLLLLRGASGIPLSEFYPFGSSAGDTLLPENDDGSSPMITLSGSFPFFGSQHTDLYVSHKYYSMHGWSCDVEPAYLTTTVATRSVCSCQQTLFLQGLAT